MDIRTCCCRNHECRLYGLTGKKARLTFETWHRGLRQRLPHPSHTKEPYDSYKKWKSVTPAMAAGLTDHVWTMDELLSFRVPLRRLW